MPGLYRYRFGRQCPWVPARIDRVQPCDPETGEPMDRALRLRCLIAGEEVDPLAVWPLWPVSPEEYERLLAEMPDDPRCLEGLEFEVNYGIVDLSMIAGYLDHAAIDAAVMAWARDASPKQRAQLRGVRFNGGGHE